MRGESNMSLIVDGRVASGAAICAQCGDQSQMVSKKLRLCKGCLGKRLLSEEKLKMRVKEDFKLDRSPDLRSCILELLLNGTLDLEPTGWRTGLALGYELIAAGFSLEDARRILIQAGGQKDKVARLLETINSGNMKACKGVWTCDQLRHLEMICSGCVREFSVKAKESKIEIYYQKSNTGREAAVELWPYCQEALKQQV